MSSQDLSAIVVIRKYIRGFFFYLNILAPQFPRRCLVDGIVSLQQLLISSNRQFYLNAAKLESLNTSLIFKAAKSVDK